MYKPSIWYIVWNSIWLDPRCGVGYITKNNSKTEVCEFIMSMILCKELEDEIRDSVSNPLGRTLRGEVR